MAEPSDIQFFEAGVAQMLQRAAVSVAVQAFPGKGTGIENTEGARFLFTSAKERLGFGLRLHCVHDLLQVIVLVVRRVHQDNEGQFLDIGTGGNPAAADEADEAAANRVQFVDIQFANVVVHGCWITDARLTPVH
jgi:hypothetical protein